MTRFAACWVIALSAGWGVAHAQYACRTGSGTTFYSDRPCPAVSASSAASEAAAAARNAAASARNSGRSGVTYHGPTESEPRPQAYMPSVGEAPPHIKYMSPRCSSLHDALRTASARGLRGETISELHKNYRSECAENESEASSRWHQERGEKSQQKRAEQNADKVARDRAALREQQCGESKRILVNKRARTDLNDGEKAELQRFEENFRSRCS